MSIKDKIKETCIYKKIQPLRVKLSYKKIRADRKKFIKIYEESKYSDVLKNLKDRHKGERCFLIGNGPSLTIADLEKIKKEYTFACNKIYKSFGDTSFRPSYYVVDDYSIVRDDFENIKEVESKESFVCLEHQRDLLKKYGETGVTVVRKWSETEKGFPVPSRNLDEYIGAGHTVLFPAYQLAVQMGFKEMYIIGVDCNFSNTGANWFYGDKKKVEAGATDAVHMAFEAIKVHAEKNDIKVYNATRGGKLEIFKRVNLEEII